MSVEIRAYVTSNVDRLSARAVDRLYLDLLSRALSRGEESLRRTVPKDTGAMERHVGKKGPDSAGGQHRGEIGVSRVTSVSKQRAASYFPGEQNSEDYPLFVSRGTGLFGPAHAPIRPRRARAMRFDTPEGPIFRSEVKGQHAQDFLLDTYEEVRRVVLPLEAKVFEQRVRSLASDPFPSA